MDPEEVKAFYQKEDVVLHYASAVYGVGLWRSEELLLTRLFLPQQKILELGCGAGRISFGMHALGYHSITATDYSESMIEMARSISEERGISQLFEVADACSLPYEDNVFDGAIFGFNGLMQIPHSSRRMQAMGEICRVIKKGSHFFFTTHDRTNPRHKKHWKHEQKLWKYGEQPEKYDEFGDRIGDTAWGEMYIYVPVREEIMGQLEVSGFRLLTCEKRSVIAVEDQATRDFSDECLIWVATKR